MTFSIFNVNALTKVQGGFTLSLRMHVQHFTLVAKEFIKGMLE